jgi:hypothetical protein
MRGRMSFNRGHPQNSAKQRTTLCPRSWQQLRDSRESKRFRLFAFQDRRCDFRWERKANRSHRMRRNHLKGRGGDRINAVLAAAGYNFSLLLRRFGRLLCALLLILARAVLVARFA